MVDLYEVGKWHAVMSYKYSYLLLEPLLKFVDSVFSSSWCKIVATKPLDTCMDNAFKTIIVRIFFTFIPGNCLSYDYLDNDLLAIKEKVSLKKTHTQDTNK